MYEWDQPKYFLLLAVVPILLLGYLLLYSWKRRKQSAFAQASSLKGLLPDISFRKYWLKAVLLVLTSIALTLALVNPRMGIKRETVKRKGVDLFFLLDVSKSMLAEDVAPSRFARARELINRIIGGLVGDRIGIIVYAGRPYNLLPITTDYAAAKFFLRGVDTDIVPSQGTAIAQALGMTGKILNRDKQKNRFVVILSDGEDHGSNAVAASKALAKNGIHVFTIGLGTTQGGPIPIKDQGRIIGYKKDSKGQTVITRMHPETLNAMATAGKGHYLYGSNSATVVKYFKQVLAKADKNEFKSESFTDYKNQFQWFLALALILLIFDSLALARKTAWIKRLNPFNESSDEA